MTINVRVRNLEEIQSMLKECPYGTRRVALYAASWYLMGTEHHGLQWYPSRTSPFYRRTGTLRHGWHLEGGDYKKRIVNFVPYAKWVVGDNTQAAHVAKYGWRTVSKNIADNLQGALLRARQAVAKWIKEHERH